MAKGLFRRVAEKLFSSRKAPARTTTQAAQVRDRQYGGSTKDMARAFGVTQRTVERWIKGDRTPPTTTAKDREKYRKAVEKARAENKPEPVFKAKPGDRLETEAAAVQVTDRGRERKAKQLERQGAPGLRVRVERTEAFQVRGSVAVRPRPVEVDLTPEEAGRLARATDDAEVQGIVGGAVARYFNGGAYGGFRGDDFTIDPGDVDLT